jgi:glycosyltransferase involved in cell wall biosynthesis
MSVAICILAKDEEKLIAGSLRQIAHQTFIRVGIDVVEVHVVANGCTDNTVAAAHGCQDLFYGPQVTFHVHDLHPGGKSRAWNRAVHELTSKAVDTLVFVDADVTFVSETVIEDMVGRLKADNKLAALSSYPVKDVYRKSSKNILDQFSLLVSSRTRHFEVINGQLYVARAKALREIWLPDQIPGEDGFLNAMLSTQGFTRPADPALVAETAEPTHYFHSHSPLEFVSHERRMIVGTMINRWIFEYLWSLRSTTPAGELIRSWNRTDPAWVDRLVAERAGKAKWLIPSSILFSRFKGRAGRPLWKHAAYMPAAVAASLLTLPPAILANKRLKEVGAAATW